MNIHAQVMAHMMWAVLSNSLAEDKTSVMEAVKHSPTSCSNTQAREKRQNSYMCLTSNLTAMTAIKTHVYQVPTMSKLQAAFPPHWKEESKPITTSACQARL